VSAEKVILLLGRRDEPTDGVADYCEKLREAGLARGISFEPVQIPWAEIGWGRALAQLRKAAAGWRDRWVLLQYTTLAWSRRGFPLRAPRVLDILRQCGARPGVVFHDFAPLPGTGIVGHAREYCHSRVLRRLHARSDMAIFTVPLNKISWLPQRREKSVFIPVGANCPEMISAVREDSARVMTVAVYGITGGDRTPIEIADIVSALKQVRKTVGPVRLLLFGRGSRDAEPSLRSELAAVDVPIECLGLLRPDQIAQALAGADVLLFVRGTISSRRGSAIAGIACGLPIVCFAGPDTAWPVTESGLVAVPVGDREALSGALESVLCDEAYRRTLAERSRQAQEKFFSWAAIVRRFEQELHLKGEDSAPDRIPETSAATRMEPGSRSTK
jgi:glycosyltransferase involved in cell wall biosynthesis